MRRAYKCLTWISTQWFTHLKGFSEKSTIHADLQDILTNKVKKKLLLLALTSFN